MAEHNHAHEDAGSHAREPRGDEPACQRRSSEPACKQRQRIARVAAERDVMLVRELADRREDDDRNDAGERERSQKKRRTPRKSVVRTGTTRTSLAEFGDSIIRPPPMNMATWPTTGCS
jgi:hypothetical protein